jgi:hypothetical protein
MIEPVPVEATEDPDVVRYIHMISELGTMVPVLSYKAISPPNGAVP